MKTLILNGSPRIGGNTSVLIDETAKLLNGTCRIIDCCRENIAPCTDCRSCRKELRCVIADDMQDIYACLSEYDNLILASPVHYAALSCGLLTVVSRFQMYSSALIFRHESIPVRIRRGGVLLTQGGSGGAEIAYETAKAIFQSIGVSEVYPLVCSANTDKTEAADNPNALFAAQNLAQWLNAAEEMA